MRTSVTTKARFFRGSLIVIIISALTINASATNYIKNTLANSGIGKIAALMVNNMPTVDNEPTTNNGTSYIITNAISEFFNLTFFEATIDEDAESMVIEEWMLNIEEPQIDESFKIEPWMLEIPKIKATSLDESFIIEPWMLELPEPQIDNSMTIEDWVMDLNKY